MWYISTPANLQSTEYLKRMELCQAVEITKKAYQKIFIIVEIMKLVINDLRKDSGYKILFSLQNDMRSCSHCSHCVPRRFPKVRRERLLPGDRILWPHRWRGQSVCQLGGFLHRSQVCWRASFPWRSVTIWSSLKLLKIERRYGKSMEFAMNDKKKTRYSTRKVNHYIILIDSSRRHI